MARKDPKKAQKIRNMQKRWDDVWTGNNKQYHEYMSFILGEQWEREEAKLFENNKKIPLTSNKIAPLAANLLGEQQENTANMDVLPVESVPVQAAKIREALVKDIALGSHSKEISQNAFMQAVIGGFGASSIGTEYENDHGFNQIIKEYAIKDPTKCYWDLAAESPCKTDGMYAGKRTMMSRKMFRSIYGKNLERKIGNDGQYVTDYIDAGAIWSDEHNIIITDHYERHYSTFTLYQMSNGDSLKQSELDDLSQFRIDPDEKNEMLDGMEYAAKDEDDEDDDDDSQPTMMYMLKGEVVTVKDEREVPRYKVKHSIWAGDYELESTEMTCQQLPLVFHDQKSYFDKSGKQICRPFFKDARDVQRYANYLLTQSAYIVKVSRYDQYMGAVGNARTPDTQAKFKDPANLQGMLTYDEVDSGVVPIQLRPPELSQSLMLQYDKACMDIQSNVGMFNTQIGGQGNEDSGDAIESRSKQGSYNTFVCRNSALNALRCRAEIINEMIPSIYDTHRTLKLNMPDVGEKDVEINKPKDEYTDEKENDMTKGDYKIRVVPGKSFEGQQADDLSAYQMIIQNDPETFRMIADKYVESLPLHGSNSLIIRNRLKALVPPDIVQAGETGVMPKPKQPQPDPEVMIKIQALQQKQQEAQMNFKNKQDELSHKQQIMQLDAHSQGASHALEIAKIQSQREEAAAEFKTTQDKLHTELLKIQAGTVSKHHDNIARILTHNTGFLDKPDSNSTSKDNEQ